METKTKAVAEMGHGNGSCSNENTTLPNSASETKLSEKSSKNTENSTESEYVVREQDRFMPIANVIRIMRKILPSHAKISDDAKETIQECVSEFISFVTSEANERCQREQRKTITAEDVLWSMSKLGFDEYMEPLTQYLHRYRDFEGERVSIREPTPVKRTVELRPMSAVGYPPTFPMARPRGMFPPPPPPPPPMNGYFRGGHNMNQNQGPMGSFDPFAAYNGFNDNSRK